MHVPVDEEVLHFFLDVFGVVRRARRPAVESGDGIAGQPVYAGQGVMLQLAGRRGHRLQNGQGVDGSAAEAGATAASVTLTRRSGTAADASSSSAREFQRRLGPLMMEEGRPLALMDVQSPPARNNAINLRAQVPPPHRDRFNYTVKKQKVRKINK